MILFKQKYIINTCILKIYSGKLKKIKKNLNEKF